MHKNTITIPGGKVAHAIDLSSHEFVCDASDLGLAPGEWPDKVTLETISGFRTDLRAAENKGWARRYSAIGANRYTVTIYND